MHMFCPYVTSQRICQTLHVVIADVILFEISSIVCLLRLYAFKDVTNYNINSTIMLSELDIWSAYLY